MRSGFAPQDKSFGHSHAVHPATVSKGASSLSFKIFWRLLAGLKSVISAVFISSQTSWPPLRSTRHSLNHEGHQLSLGISRVIPSILEGFACLFVILRNTICEIVEAKLSAPIENAAKNGVFCPGGLRVRPNTSSRITEFSEHEADGGEFQESDGTAVEIFPVLGEAATAIEPRNRTFYDPTLG